MIHLTPKNELYAGSQLTDARLDRGEAVQEGEQGFGMFHMVRLSEQQTHFVTLTQQRTHSHRSHNLE